jgi:SAM-dependent methyltransferase
VDCIDIGKSVYFKKEKYNIGINRIYGNFNHMSIRKKYDLVWSSHILEHQRNPGLFLEKMINCCKSNGVIIMTVPYPHFRLLGGHLTLWTPGLLIYNLVMCGLNLKKAKIIEGKAEFSVLLKPKKVNLPSTLSFDKGDIKKLRKFMPKFIREGGSSYIFK